jgi:hypothetical protein
MRVPDGPLVEFVPVENPDVHLLTALALYGPHVRCRWSGPTTAISGRGSAASAGDAAASPCSVRELCEQPLRA